jgi:uncharacterized protein YprB with RNaseH-like and TPR domain
MLRSTFQMTCKVPDGGRPVRVSKAVEARLWAAGVTDWRDLDGAPERLIPPRLRLPLRQTAAALDQALEALDLPALARALPTAEHWRLFSAFESRAIYLDIETDFQEGITAVGILDHDGPRILLPWRDLASFPDLVPPDSLLVTFNGASFDVPILRRFFPGWRPPAAHIDLRPLLVRLGERGGLKAIEERLGLGRPDHLRGLSGRTAATLFRWGGRGDQGALRLFAEYNLYDTINLRTLMALAYNRALDALPLPAPRVTVSWRGDVLYDVSKALLAL